MSTPTKTKDTDVYAPSGQLLARVLDEGYGPGAWHGPDLKSALADVDAQVAFWRPAAARHNIAEIALHHAYCVHSVRQRLARTPLESFPLAGDDWFVGSGEPGLDWPAIRELVDTEQRDLAALVRKLDAGRLESAKTNAEQLELVLGITCHAIYHAGQIQLIKRLRPD
jgi:DinB superfamily